MYPELQDEQPLNIVEFEAQLVIGVQVDLTRSIAEASLEPGLQAPQNRPLPVPSVLIRNTARPQLLVRVLLTSKLLATFDLQTIFFCVPLVFVNTPPLTAFEYFFESIPLNII